MDNVYYYTTIRGDTWDIISKNVYGSTKYAHIVLDANLNLSETVIFDSGVEIIIPEIAEIGAEETGVNLPPWRAE